MKTKLLKTAIMAGLLGAFIHGSANAATFENFKYEVVDGNVTITGHVEDVSGELVIPETIDGKTVIAIKENAFENCAEITEVQIPDTVKTIGVCAFFNCEKLEKIDISSNLTNLDETAFWLCKSLADISVDENNAYYSTDEAGVLFNKDKTMLIQYPLASEETAYIIPDSVTEINDSAFDGNVTLTTLTLGEGITKLDNNFIDLENLAYLEIGKNVAEIEDNALRHNNQLTKITVDEENSYYSSDEFGVLFNKDKTMLIKYPAKNPNTEYIIPETVTTIFYHAFLGNTELTKISIPDNVTKLVNKAFYGCTGLKSVKIGKGITTLQTDLFAGCTGIETIILHEGIKSIERDCFGREECNIKTIEYAGTPVQWECVFVGDAELLNTANVIFGVNLMINGQEIDFDRSPIIENGRTLVPFRAVLEGLGAEILWDDETKTVTAEKDGISVVLQIGSDEMKVGEEVKTLEVAAKIADGRTLVPARAVAEALGCSVDWDDASRTVIIEN